MTSPANTPRIIPIQPWSAPAAPKAELPADHPLSPYLGPGPLQLHSLPPLSLYVHLPWCLKKCPYCDFNSHAQPASGLPQAQYLQALLDDLDASLPLIWGRPIVSIFFGGGTPSLIEPQALADWLSQVRARLPIQPDAEITLEANPGSFETGRFAAFAQAGVNRLSIGVQSFHDDHLQALGRVHNAQQAHDAVTEAQRHFTRFNIDLMYALPQQTLGQLQTDLDAALAFNPPHLSIYHLTIERNTAFFRQPPAHLPDNDLASDMLDLICQETQRTGLQRYEVSAFARPEPDAGPSQHNLNYWGFGDYLGIGAGAHSKLSFPHHIWRQTRWREPEQYMQAARKGQAVSRQNSVQTADLPFEFMLNALRLRHGVPEAWWRERTGLPSTALQVMWEKAQRKGWVDAASFPPKAWASNNRGFDFLSDLQELFLPE